MERNDLSDRRFDVLLARLDRIGDELAKLNRRAANDENFLKLTRELASLNESLQALAYAALGQQAPQSSPLPPSPNDESPSILPSTRGAESLPLPALKLQIVPEQ